MKKELIAAVLFAASFTSCTDNKEQQPRENTSSAMITSSSAEADETTAPVTAATTTETTAAGTTSVITETTAVSTASEETTESEPDLSGLHKYLRLGSEYSIEDYSVRDMYVYIDQDTADSLGIEYDDMYADYEPPVIEHELSDDEKQLMLDYILSHDLSAASGYDDPVNMPFVFFSADGVKVDKDNMAFTVIIAPENATPQGYIKFVFSRDREVLGANGIMAGSGFGNYFLLEDQEQLQHFYDIAEQYTYGN